MPVLTVIMLVFGPEHGRQFVWNEMLPDPMIVPDSSAFTPQFQEYRAGKPYGGPRKSMMQSTHIYVQHDIYDQGTETCAIYFHSEECCDKDYSKTSLFEPVNRNMYE